jgi:hypothetical protein
MFLSSCSPGIFHEKSEGASFSDMVVPGLALIGLSSPFSLMGRRDVYLAKSVDAATTVGPRYLLDPDALARSVKDNEQSDPSNHLTHIATFGLNVQMMVGHVSDLLAEATDDRVLADVLIS